MKYKILDGPNFGTRLSEKMAEDHIPIQLAVAYIGKGLPSILGKTQLNGAKIVCDYLSGGTNPHAVSELEAEGVEVRHLDGLHAKIGMVGEALSFVGSSNLSSNGLQKPEGQHYERTVVFEWLDPEVKASWEKMWPAATSISDEMRAQAEEI